jgi:hypothetical protein
MRPKTVEAQFRLGLQDLTAETRLALQVLKEATPDKQHLLLATIPSLRPELLRHGLIRYVSARRGEICELTALGVAAVDVISEISERAVAQLMLAAENALALSEPPPVVLSRTLRSERGHKS